MVLHSWVLKSLRILEIGSKVIDLMEFSMPNWKSNMYSCEVHLRTVSIQRGIFQGNSFSPLLLVIIPLTRVLQKVHMGYDLKKNNREHSLNHLLFMNDLKLFAKFEEQIDSLV